MDKLRLSIFNMIQLNIDIYNYEINIKKNKDYNKKYKQVYMKCKK